MRIWWATSPSPSSSLWASRFWWIFLIGTWNLMKISNFPQLHLLHFNVFFICSKVAFSIRRNLTKAQHEDTHSVHERVDMSMTGKFFVLKNKVSHSSFQLVRWFITFFKGKRVKFFMLPTASHAFSSFHKWSNKVSREWVYMHEIKKAENFLLSGSHYDENENEVKNELWNKLPSEINWKLAVLRAMEMIFFPLVHDAPLSSPCLSHPIISST